MLNKDFWTNKPIPVFQSTDSVISPGHASFVKSPDGKEDWIVYHTARKKGAGWDRTVRIQKFNWNPDGSPDFGSPLPNDAKISVPSE
jgi:GH43 family beta-xylosidase